MVPSLTRRQALRLGAGAAVAGGVASQIRIDPVNTWEPAPGTWPCDRYDLGNTAANPHTSLPADPELDWQRPFTYLNRFVVGPERVFVSVGETLTALGKSDGTAHWETDVPWGHLAVHDGTLYHARHDAPRLTAFDAETGRRRWRTRVDSGAEGIDNLLVSAETAIITTEGRASWSDPNLVAYDTRDGSRRWGHFRGRGGYESLAAHEGFLYAGNGSVDKYRHRSLLQVGLGVSLTKAWKDEFHSHWIVVVDDHVLAGDFAVYVEDDSAEQRPGIAAYDARSGERMWGTIWPEHFDHLQVDDSVSLSDYGVFKPAIAGDRCFVQTRAHFNPPTRHELVAFSLTDGAVLWHQPLDPSDIVVAGDAVLVSTGNWRKEAPPRGVIRALDPATGSELWRVATQYDPIQLAVAGGTLFANTQGPDGSERMIALR